MITGKIVRYDSSKGYGFLSQDLGGEDVFLHINDINIDENLLKIGARVEYEVEESGRGLKATRVVFIDGLEVTAPIINRDEKYISKVDSSDSLSSVDFIEEITELLLDASPSLTSEQILRIRRHFADFAFHRGWIT